MQFFFFNQSENHHAMAKSQGCLNPGFIPYQLCVLGPPLPGPVSTAEPGVVFPPSEGWRQRLVTRALLSGV